MSVFYRHLLFAWLAAIAAGAICACTGGPTSDFPSSSFGDGDGLDDFMTDGGGAAEDPGRDSPIDAAAQTPSVSDGSGGPVECGAAAADGGAADAGAEGGCDVAVDAGDGGADAGDAGVVGDGAVEEGEDVTGPGPSDQSKVPCDKTGPPGQAGC